MAKRLGVHGAEKVVFNGVSIAQSGKVCSVAYAGFGIKG